MISGQYFFVGAIYMAKHFIEWNLPFKKGNCAAARALYRKKIAAEHFIESISFERGPRGERGVLGALRERAKSVSKLKLFWRARVRVCGAPRAPFTLRTPFKGIFFLCWTGHFIPCPLLDTGITIWMFGISLYSHGTCSQVPSETHTDFLFLRGQATLYNVGFWLYRQNLLAFHFIDANHVTIPVYTRLLSIKSAAKHLASCTWGITTLITLHRSYSSTILQLQLH